jgi:uncharacterized LabA/DUF88 family protein
MAVTPLRLELSHAEVGKGSGTKSISTHTLIKKGLKTLLNQIIQMKNDYTNAAVYVDYENIFELLKRYGKNPLEIDFFPVLLNKLRERHKLNVIDFIVYSNFEKQPFFGRHQTILQGLGLQTRHSSNNGKNSGDLELTVDALKTLYKNQIIEVFVIISSDRDIIPLIKAIKYENKTTYVLSTKNGFNQIVTKYADHHEYIEDIFNLNDNLLEQNSPTIDWDLNFKISQISEENINEAKKVCKLFYGSNIWSRHEKQGDTISLDGYLNAITKTLDRIPAQIINDFKLSHHLGYIKLYKDSKNRLCLDQGPNRNEVT